MRVDKKILDNFISLTSLRAVTIIVPLVTYPYLLKTLGADKYGLVIWSWSIVNLFVVFVKFGFDVSATRFISEVRYDSEKLNHVVSQVLWSKITLLIVSSLIYFLLIFSVEAFSNARLVFFFSFLLLVSETFSCIWYYQGLEKMRFTSIMTSSIKLIFSCLVFVFVNDESDFYLVILMYSVPALLTSFISLYIIFFVDNVRLKKYDFKKVKFYIKDSSPIFFSSSLSMIKDSFTIIILEKFIGFSAVAAFDLINKVVSILITPFHIISSVLYPRVSLNKDYRYLFSWLKSSFVLSVLLTMLMIYLYPIVLDYLELSDYVVFYVIMVSSVIILNLCSMLGTCGLAAFGNNRHLLFSSLISVVSYFSFLILLFYFFGYEIELLAVSLALSSLLECIVRYLIVNNKSKCKN